MTQAKEESSELKKEVLSIGKNSMIYMIGQSLSRVVGFFMIPVYTRYIAPSNYGAMEIVEIISSILLLTISIGASDSMSRYYYSKGNQEERNAIVSTLIIGFAVISIPVVFLFWLSAPFLSKYILEDNSYINILQIAFITAWFGMLCDFGFSYFRMIYRAKLFVTLTTLQLFIALSLNIWFIIYLKLDITGIFYSTLISQGIIGILMSLCILRQVGTKLSANLLYEMIRFGMPLVPSRIGLMLGFVSNRFFLRWLGPADPAIALGQIGLFALGHKFGVIINRFVNAPFNSFWAPRRMELLLDSKNDSKETVARVCTYATFCSIYAGLVLSATVADAIQIMAAPSYKGAHTVVPFVVLSYIALGLETHFMTGIIYAKKTKLTAYITLFSLLIIVIWNIVFIPKYGLIGAATSNLAGYCIRLIMIYYVSQRLYLIPYELTRLINMLVVALGLYFISQLIVLPSPYASIAAKASITILFPIVLYSTRFFNDGERKFINKAIQKCLQYLRIPASISWKRDR